MEIKWKLRTPTLNIIRKTPQLHHSLSLSPSPVSIRIHVYPPPHGGGEMIGEVEGFGSRYTHVTHQPRDHG